MLGRGRAGVRVGAVAGYRVLVLVFVFVVVYVRVLKRLGDSKPAIPRLTSAAEGRKATRIRRAGRSGTARPPLASGTQALLDRPQWRHNSAQSSFLHVILKMFGFPKKCHVFVCVCVSFFQGPGPPKKKPGWGAAEKMAI